MITLTDVLKRNHPLTVYEDSIINCVIACLITFVVVLFSFIYILIENGIKELVSVISTINGISVSLAVWLFILICGNTAQLPKPKKSDIIEIWKDK